MDKLEINLGTFAQDERLIEQFCTRKSKVDAKGRLQLESKDEMRKRGLSSPDRADAVIGAFSNASYGNVGNQSFCGQSLSEMLEQVAPAEMAGFDAGY
jgi:hypothetical protein